MSNRSFYNEILTEHNLRPEHKHPLPDADLSLDGVNPSCGDEITLKLKVQGDTIVDGAFEGDGCAISQASADIMLGMIIGRRKEEALHLGQLFFSMIRGEATEGSWRSWRRRRLFRTSPICLPGQNVPCWGGTPWSRCWKQEDKKIRSTEENAVLRFFALVIEK